MQVDDGAGAAGEAAELTVLDLLQRGQPGVLRAVVHPDPGAGGVTPHALSPPGAGEPGDLERLARLRESGALSEDGFAAAEARLLR